MGMALTSCTVPHVGKPTFDLPGDEMEMGVGIHGEPGRTRMKLKSADEIVELLMEPILTDLPYRSGDEVLMFVNGLGGTPLIELYLMYNEVNKILSKHGVSVARSLVGSYITSLEMAGSSVTLLKANVAFAMGVEVYRARRSILPVLGLILSFAGYALTKPFFFIAPVVISNNSTVSPLLSATPQAPARRPR